jgi:predicted RNA binding protein YcfA (HicA-like mRNA interferase family)
VSAQFPPLDCRQVKRIFAALGFEPRSQKGSHEQWVRDDRRGFFKVTVDCPKQPFTGDLIASMARQAGVSKKDFYAKLND